MTDCQLCKSKVPRFPSEIYSAHLVSFSEQEPNGLPKFGTSASIFIPCSEEDRKKMIEMDERLKVMDAKKSTE